MSKVTSKDELKNVDPTPFQILGIQPTPNKAEVTCAYRRMLLMIHPDKANKNSKINWSREERNEAFRKIRKAYKTILREYTFNDLPEYDIEYQDLSKEENPLPYINDIDKFNKVFEEHKKQLEISGALGPENIGYSDFNRTITDPKKYKQKLQKNYKPTKKHSSKKQQQLVTHKPQTAPEQKNFFEFGLTTIGDYGISSFGKSNLTGSDLSQVFQEQETWENSAKKLKKKYNDETDIQLKLKNFQQERRNLNIDEEYSKAEQNEALERQKQIDYNQKIRMIQQERDNVFSVQHNLIKY